MQITDLDHVFIWSKDPDKSRRFYCDVLGFQEMPRPPAKLPGYWLGINGKVQIHMGLDGREQGGRNSAGPVIDHVAFAAQDPERWASHIRELGICITRALHCLHEHGPNPRHRPGWRLR